MLYGRKTEKACVLQEVSGDNTSESAEEDGQEQGCDDETDGKKKEKRGAPPGHEGYGRK